MITVLITFFLAFSISGAGLWAHHEPKDRPKELIELRQPSIPGGALTQALKVEPQSEIKFRDIVRQAYDYSCGSAALVTVLNSDLGFKVTEQQAMEGMLEFGEKDKITERRGFSLLDMKRYVASLGSKSDGFRGEISDLQELTTPAIVPIDYAGAKHFVVLRGVRDGHVYIADPSAGKLVFTLSAFTELWDRNTLFLIYRNEESSKAEHKLALTDKELGRIDMDFVRNNAVLAPLNNTLQMNKLINGYNGVSILRR